jgi:hypothetical protein
MGCLPCASHPFFPLFVASFLIDDFFANEHFFGAGTTGFSSASSKSVIIAAYLRATCEGIHIVGPTSAGNCEFVEGPKRTPFARWASDWLRVERVSGEDRLPEAVARGASNHVWEHPVVDPVDPEERVAELERQLREARSAAWRVESSGATGVSFPSSPARESVSPFGPDGTALATAPRRVPIG